MTDPVLSVEAVAVRRGDRPVLQDVSMLVRPGELLGLIGPNGSGKTTLLRAALGFQALESGRVSVMDRALADWPVRDLGRQIAYFPQDGGEAWPIRVDRFVALGRLPHLEPWRRPGASDAKAVEDAMAAADVAALASRAVTDLSGGERARVHLARALAVQAPILLADEPIAGLDPFHQLQVIEMLRRHAHRESRAVVVVLHDLTLAHRFCDRLVLLHNGRLYAEGTPESVLTESALVEAYGVRPAHPSKLSDLMVPWEREPPPP